MFNEMSNLKLSWFRDSCKEFHSLDKGEERDFKARSLILNQLSKHKRFSFHYEKILSILNQHEEDIRLKQLDERARQERITKKLYKHE